VFAARVCSSSSGARATTAAAASGAGAGAGSSAADLATSLQVQTGPVSAFSAELLSDALLGLGAQSVVVEEAREPGGGEQEVFGAEGGLWDRCHLLVHFPLEVRRVQQEQGAMSCLQPQRRSRVHGAMPACFLPHTPPRTRSAAPLRTALPQHSMTCRAPWRQCRTSVSCLACSTRGCAQRAWDAVMFVQHV
jgi:hypothetical protein